MVALSDVSLSLDQLPGEVEFASIFGRSAPVELEIGCGKGGFLLRQAQTHPERNYLGIEWANEFYRFTCDRMARWGVPNVRILRTDARHFLIQRVPTAALAALHVYHPDPWPKKRHHKRRLFSPEFVAAVVRTLDAGARIAVQSDHAEYFEVIRAALYSRPELVEAPFAECVSDHGVAGNASGGGPGGGSGEGPGTNFELKYAREGRPIYRMAFQRRPVSP